MWLISLKIKYKALIFGRYSNIKETNKLEHE